MSSTAIHTRLAKTPMMDVPQCSPLLIAAAPRLLLPAGKVAAIPQALSAPPELAPMEELTPLAEGGEGEQGGGGGGVSGYESDSDVPGPVLDTPGETVTHHAPGAHS